MSASSSAAAGAASARGYSPPAPSDDRSFFGHPRGLKTLFFTEFWERFSYYGMRALLILFMTASVANGGLGFETGKAGAIYGLYVGSVYLMALPGGWVADRIFGQRRSVLFGGIIIALGHFSMAIPSIPSFYLGLVLIVLGTGLLKPNISTMVSELYPEGGARRDAGFSVFYMGINLGAFVAPIVTGALGERVEGMSPADGFPNWHYGFAAAGFGMVFGIIQYLRGGRHLGQIGVHPNVGADPAAASRNLRRLMIGLGAAVVLAGGAWLLQRRGVFSFGIEQVAGATGGFIVGLAVLYFAYMFFWGGLNAVERKRVSAVFVFFIFSAVFWSGFEQAGSSLNLVADRLTDRTLGAWVMPASWLQSVNALMIIILAPIFAWLWIGLGKRNREPSSPAKFTLGLVFLGLGFAVMIMAAQRAASGALVSPMWLVLTYLLHTIGELCLSPVGLSTVTKLAPHRMVGQMMGVWFMSISLGNLFAGLIGGQFGTTQPAQIFMVVTAVTLGAGLLLAILIKPIRNLMSGIH
jgi:POT family proton-dependent oligopeptide transporter